MKYILAIALLLLSYTNLAAQPSSKYTTHKVKSGQTLSIIAKQYYADVEELIKLNPQAAKGLDIDQELKVPKKTPAEIKKIKEQQLADKVYLSKSGTNTIHHTIKNGENFSTIAKKYRTTIEELKQLNSALAQKTRLDIGDVVKIVITQEEYEKINTNSSEKAIVKEVEKKEIEKVKKEVPQETPIVIKKNIQQDSIKPIKKVNTDKPEKEEEAFTIEIDKSKQEACIQFIKGIDCKGITKQQSCEKTFKIAILLPFDLGSGFTSKAKSAYYFYQGAMVAIEELKQEAMSSDVYFYDTHDGINTILQKPELQEMDLIVGPLYASDFSKVAVFALENKIPIVCPFSDNIACIKNNPMVFKATASKQAELIEMANTIKQNFKNQNIIYINPTNRRDSSVQGAVNKYLLSELKKEKIAYQTIFMDNIEQLPKYLQTNDKNLIISTSSASSEIQSLINSIKRYKSAREQDSLSIPVIQVLGLNKWNAIKEINSKDLSEINFHYLDQNYFHSGNAATSSIKARITQKYMSEPTSVAYQGYDITYYFMKNLLKYGKNFAYCANDKPFENGINTGFLFKRMSEQHGFENTYFTLFKHEDGTTKKVK